VQLTPEGDILLKHIEPAINLIQKGENQLLEANTLNGGQLRIGASDTICRYYLVPYLNKFHKTYPNVHIKVTNQTSIECAHLLVSLGTLQTYPILMLERKSTTSEFLHHMFQKEQLDLVPEIELSSNDLLIDLARIGLGIAFVPDFCIPENDRDLFQVKLSEKLPIRQMVVAYNENLPVSQASKQFMDML